MSEVYYPIGQAVVDTVAIAAGFLFLCWVLDNRVWDRRKSGGKHK